MRNLPFAGLPPVPQRLYDRPLVCNRQFALKVCILEFVVFFWNCRNKYHHFIDVFLLSEIVIQIVGDTISQNRWKEEWLKLNTFNYTWRYSTLNSKGLTHEIFEYFENLSSQSSMSSSKCWEQFLFTCNVFPITVTVQGFALMIRAEASADSDYLSLSRYLEFFRSNEHL